MAHAFVHAPVGLSGWGKSLKLIPAIALDAVVVSKSALKGPFPFVLKALFQKGLGRVPQTLGGSSPHGRLRAASIFVVKRKV